MDIYILCASYEYEGEAFLAANTTLEQAQRNAQSVLDASSPRNNTLELEWCGPLDMVNSLARYEGSLAEYEWYTTNTGGDGYVIYQVTIANA